MGRQQNQQDPGQVSLLGAVEEKGLEVERVGSLGVGRKQA